MLTEQHDKKRLTSHRTRTEEMQQLLEELKRTQGALDLAQLNFEQVKDPALVDCYIYELKAAQMRYQFLLRRVKQFGI